MNKKQSPEDAFYENLTLGLIKTLCELPVNCSHIYLMQRMLFLY